jgi:predicted  nucleic acid-binding Zn-ribbon protein
MAPDAAAASDHLRRLLPLDPTADDVNEPTVDSVTQDIGDLETKLAAAREQLTTLQAAAAMAQKLADEKASDEAQLASLDKQAADLEKQKAALKQKLAKK